MSLRDTAPEPDGALRLRGPRDADPAPSNRDGACGGSTPRDARGLRSPAAAALRAAARMPARLLPLSVRTMLRGFVRNARGGRRCAISGSRARADVVTVLTAACSGPCSVDRMRREAWQRDQLPVACDWRPTSVAIRDVNTRTGAECGVAGVGAIAGACVEVAADWRVWATPVQTKLRTLYRSSATKVDLRAAIRGDEKHRSRAQS